MKKLSGLSDAAIERVGRLIAQSDFEDAAEFDEVLGRCRKLANKLGEKRALRIASDVLARGEVITNLEDCSLEELLVVEDALRGEVRETKQKVSKVAQGLDLQTWNVYMTDWDTGERQDLLGTVKTNKGPEAKEKAEGKAYAKWGVGGATIGWKIEVEPAD